MSGLRLHLRARRVPLALAVTIGMVALVWGAWSYFSDAVTVNPRMISITVLVAVVAFGATLAGADDALERTGAVNWQVRRAGHLALATAVIVGMLLLTTVTDARFEPLTLVVRNTVGLVGLVALGAALFGAALSWLPPLGWTLVAIMPFMQPSERLGTQLLAWLIQPTDATAAAVCATALAVAGLFAYSLRGCPLRPPAETAADQ
ncbi:hypothetical protein JQS43_15085 [Natronosporangium hydrolyticum]|uniref:Uncharacterized protein n=1 Tax=Natronosporangium hydrolyticum TaxID=2811111 RepID=A0A895Y6I5_9ACTN|nr:hypothetical protein [Natronosporangium hydrolyticum]QSB12981.1 hypothetical protein JQS43_15085 [Natronosporangium hydrolyticum]